MGRLGKIEKVKSQTEGLRIIFPSNGKLLKPLSRKINLVSFKSIENSPERNADYVFAREGGWNDREEKRCFKHHEGVRACSRDRDEFE